MSILLIDDDVRFLESRAGLLAQHAYKPVMATSVQDGIARLHGDSGIELVLLDLNMPRQDGFAFLEYVNCNLRFSHIPVLISSGRREGEAVARGLQLGARDYILKPAKPEVLLQKIQRALERARRTVLLVDGDGQLRGILGRIVEREGYTTLHAGSGQEALRLLGASVIDLIISEIDMPEMSGWDLLLEVKERDPQLPVLLITDGNKPGEIDPLAGGADGVISLPFENITIRRTLKEILARSQRLALRTRRTDSDSRRSMKVT